MDTVVNTRVDAQARTCTYRDAGKELQLLQLQPWWRGMRWERGGGTPNGASTKLSAKSIENSIEINSSMNSASFATGGSSTSISPPVAADPAEIIEVITCGRSQSTHTCPN